MAAAGGGEGVGSVTSVQSATDSSSPHHLLDLEREEFPGGDAMLEVLTRLQSYQESMQMQLEVFIKSLCSCVPLPSNQSLYRQIAKYRMGVDDCEVVKGGHG